MDMLLKEMSGGHVIEGDVWWTCYKKEMSGGHVIKGDVW